MIKFSGLRDGRVYLFLFVVTSNVLLTGGRLASSDELSLYLTTESLVERGDLAISPDLVSNGIYGSDGRFYSGVGIGQPVVAIPSYLLGKAIVAVGGISEPMRTLVLRGSVSLLNQLLAGLIAVTMFAFGIRLGYSKRLSLFLTLGLLFTTNLFPYLKSYMREPQLLLYLLTTVYFLYMFKKGGRRTHLWYAGAASGIGLLTRLTFFLNIPVLFAYLLFVLGQQRREEGRNRSQIVRDLMAFAGPITVAVVINAIYNYIQFGGISTMPYANAEFSTPLLTGLYGLLLSSGKSYFLFAPLTVLALWSLPYFARSHKPELYLFLGMFVMNLIFFAKFVAWAGDGSWGPRYLISTLPFLVLPAGALIRETIVAKRWALTLSAIGFIIQVGGVSIYLGSYIREIGEYPYTKEFSDPEFLYKSHFVPNYSPVVGHWKMLLRNVPFNFSKERPTFAITNSERRIPLSDETQSNLRYTLDFWFMYAWYAGIRPVVIALALLPLLIFTCFLGYKTFKTIGAPLIGFK